MSAKKILELTTFPTPLGWMAFVADASCVHRLIFGLPSEAAIVAALGAQLIDRAEPQGPWSWLVERLRQYLSGQHVEFDDVPLQLDHLSRFQQRVVRHCRAIPYGQTRSYKQLAEASGSPRAARAVGNTMATNRYPIIVPCHRVVSASGSVGEYSGAAGQRTKLRLLEIEGLGSSPPAPTRRRGQRLARSLTTARQGSRRR
jgi:methylated-DNA-[protein]-cysteine S-methyltransferase